MISDNPLFIAIRQEIINQLVGQGFDANDIRCVRGSQPTQQAAGASSDTRKYQIFLTPITRQKVNVTRTNRIDGTDLYADYSHNKLMTWQIDCLTDFDPSDINSIDANNFCGLINDLLMHHDALTTLKQSGVYVVNCGDVRPPYTILDSDTYESTPSFDLLVNYGGLYSKLINGIESAQGEINGVQ